MKPNFLFHVPGAKNLFNPDTNTFPYKSNWLSLDELRSLPDKPLRVDVVQVQDNRSVKLGKINTNMALEKFTGDEGCLSAFIPRAIQPRNHYEHSKN